MPSSTSNLRYLVVTESTILNVALSKMKHILLAITAYFDPLSFLILGWNAYELMLVKVRSFVTIYCPNKHDKGNNIKIRYFAMGKVLLQNTKKVVLNHSYLVSYLLNIKATYVVELNPAIVLFHITMAVKVNCIAFQKTQPFISFQHKP